MVQLSTILFGCLCCNDCLRVYDQLNSLGQDRVVRRQLNQPTASKFRKRLHSPLLPSAVSHMRWYIVSAILIVLAIEVCCLNTKEENRLSDRGYTKFSKRIERLMLGDYKRHSTRGQDGEWNVWVIFVDKGRISQSRQVLDSLHPNAIERRRKHRYDHTYLYNTQNL